MKQEMTWGAAAAVAIAAAIGLSSLSTKPREGAPAGRQAEAITAKSKTTRILVHHECSDLIEMFQTFLLDENVAGPKFCYGPGDAPLPGATNPSKDTTLQTKYVIATLPDPLHTHFSLLFDRFVEAIQQGAQDENYQYDSSWLPWETEEPALTLLGDQDEADDRKKKREDQPGVLLFHAAPHPGQSAREPYQKGLFVFIVGEDSTDGIHRKQFENAVAWIAALQRGGAESPVAILGPTFSGSFPSLSELLSDPKVLPTLNSGGVKSGKRLAIYSGSVTSKKDAEWFAKSNPSIVMHSFLQDDDTALGRFCKYLEKPKKNGEKTFDLRRLAVLSEDETAYGYDGTLAAEEHLCEGASWLYYPRDISTLRSAYQKQSIFNSASGQPDQGAAPRNSLPSDLADPAGKEHDTVRTYAGNQTPLSQEAELLGVVGALRSHRAQFVVLISSNTLDPLFLANFLRREYPEARVVVLNSDLLFQRGRDAMQLSGVMTLSTYPLFPWEREWTERPPFLLHSHRVFPENSTEATYIASRLVLQSPMFGDDPDHPASCTLSQDSLHDVFVPSIICEQKDGMQNYLPVPDYAPPFWTGAPPCNSGVMAESCQPATWLSVITKSGSWPLAVLNDQTLRPPQSHIARKAPPGSPASKPASGQEWPPVPLSMKLFLVSLFGLSLFHLSCCCLASFTAKPAFRAHFATPGWQHRVLIVMGSFLIALMALLSGWGCGMFSRTPGLPLHTGAVRPLVYLIWGVAGLSIVANLVVTRKLNVDANEQRWDDDDARFRWLVILLVMTLCLLIGMSFRAFVHPLECALSLANRVPAYWRSMNLASGVSPLVPFLSLTLGFYIWFWYLLHGVALFGPDRPRLPEQAKLIIAAPEEDQNGAKNQQPCFLRMFSEEYAAKPAERAAKPLAWKALLFSLIMFLVFWLLVATVVREAPVRSLGAKTYAKIFCFWLDFCFSLILGAALQLWQTWSQLRQLLVFLDRLPLRRTLGALRGFSWGTVWRMSGNVLDVRYKLLSRQLQSLNHLHTSLQELQATDPRLEESELTHVENCLTAVEEARKAGRVFAQWYSANYGDPQAAGLRSFKELQKQIGATSGFVLANLLVPAWRKEKHSLILVEAHGKGEDERTPCPPLSTQEHLRNAEELVCLTYLGFAQNVLGRIRTIALGALFLFVATTLAVSNYPFDPRPALSGALFALFITFGAVIVFVYADIHRDSTLSHITNTSPGELGSEFWFKIVGFGAAPLIGLITTIFPDLSGFLFSWLQPGLSSLK